MTKTNFLHIINSYTNIGGLISKIKKDKDFYHFIFKETSFLPENYSIGARIYSIKNNITNIPLCICGKHTKFISGKFSKTCGNKKCIHKQTKNSFIEKYGVEWNFQADVIKKQVKQTIRNKYQVDYISQVKAIKEKSAEIKLKKYGDKNYTNRKKAKKTCLEKYGVDNPQKNLDIQKKTKQTNLKKYGYTCSLQNKDIAKKAEKTFLEKYNNYHSNSSELVKEKKKKTFLEKYGVDNPMKNTDIQEKAKKTNHKKRKIKLNNLLKKGTYIFKDINTIIYTCPKCHKESEISLQFINLRINRYNLDICLHCIPYKTSSGQQLELSNWIRSLNKKIEKNYKLKNNKELDIYIPDKNLGIEFNGLYWHSEIFKNRNYHLEKLKQANKENIQLLNIWEDDWICKKNIVKSIIKSKLGLSNKIHGRQTIIRNVNSKDTRNFLDQNHLQGFVPSSIKLGLFYNNELVSLMTFGKRNINNKTQYELLRFANKLNYTVIGGVSKLFKYFLDNYNINNLISYVNRDITTSNLYEKLGFNLIGETSPGYWWFKNKTKYNRIKFQKYKLIKMGHDPNLKEFEIMHNLGFYRIYNTGNLKYEFKSIK